MTIHFERVTRPHGESLRRQGHWFLRDKPRGQWIPEAVGIVHAYPSTLEAWERRQACGFALAHLVYARPPYGWKGTKKELLRLRAKARERTAAKMEKIRMAIKFEDPRAEKAIDTVLQILELKDDKGQHIHGPKDLIAAARLLCDFTQPKPVTKNEHVIKAAEDWLEGLE